MADVLNKAHAENLLSLLARDEKNGKIIAGLIEPELFEGELRVVAERLKNYWKKYKKPPGNAHTADLFSDILEDQHNHKRETYRRIIRNMAALVDDINPDYALHTLRVHARLARMKDGILKAAERVNSNEEIAIEDAEEIIATLLRARQYQFDRGMTLSDIDRVVDYLEGHFSEFRTGIVPFDARNIVPARGTVFLFLAPTGYGKTWFLIHIGKHGLMQRKRVLHISLEMSEEEVLQRYYQSLFSIAKRTEDVSITKFELDDDLGLSAVLDDADTFTPKVTFEDKLIRKRLRKQIKPWVKKHLTDRLIVKRFPPRQLSMNGLRAYLDALEAQGFIPDLCVLDYIGITSTDAKNHRITLGRAYEDFRAIMVERNMAGVTAHQVSKAGMEARVVKTTHVAEDVSLIGTSDIAVTFSQTDAEQRVGLARMRVDKARSEADKFGVVITQSYAIGQFVLESARLSKTYWQHVETLHGSEEDGSDDDDEQDEDHPARLRGIKRVRPRKEKRRPR